VKIEQPITENEAFSLPAFRHGDPIVFKWVYERLAKSLLYFVQNIIDSTPDAEDIVASAFLKLYNARAGMESFDHVKRWLYVIVRNEDPEPGGPPGPGPPGRSKRARDEPGDAEDEPAAEPWGGHRQTA